MTTRKYGKEVATIWLARDRPDTSEQSVAEIVPAMRKLLEHYEISDSNWMLLAFRLAVDGGFIRYKNDTQLPGRSKKWTDRELVKLWAKVQLAMRRNERRTESAICASLESEMGVTGIRQQLAKAKKLSVVAMLSQVLVAMDDEGRLKECLAILAE